MPDVSQSLHAFYLWHIKRTCKRAGPGTLRNLLEIELGVDYICPIVLDKKLRHDQYRDDLSDENWHIFVFFSRKGKLTGWLGTIISKAVLALAARLV